MSIKWKLYKLAVKYIAACDRERFKDDPIKLSTDSWLTHKVGDKYYLDFGLDNYWKNFARYNVIDNAIQKLGIYEDKEIREKIKK